ncbi:MAG: hypothetical protein ABI377_07580, partial [Devosia sp.]
MSREFGCRWRGVANGLAGQLFLSRSSTAVKQLHSIESCCIHSNVARCGRRCTATRSSDSKVYRAKGSDETRIAQGVETVLHQLGASNTSLDIQQVSGTVGYTLDQYEGSMSMLYEGAILAIIVVLVFLLLSMLAAAQPASFIPLAGLAGCSQ